MIPIAVVGTNGRLRKLSRPKVREIADSITEIGLLNPITVVATGSEYMLVAGRHRLEAARALDWKMIPAVIVDLNDVDRHLAEIDENLMRSELSDLERSEHLASRKRWYETKHPETRRGTAGGRARQGIASEIISFAEDAAQKIEKTVRSIQQDVQIAESIPEDVREAIRETPLADSKTDLLAMARLPEAAQREVVSTVDLNDKAAVRHAVASHRTARPALAPDPEPEIQTTEVLVTVEGFARAVLSLFTHDECGRLIGLIREGLR
jgi:ParB family chromosome partitioning protein